MGKRFNAQITYEDVDPDIEYVNDEDGMLVSYDDYASLEGVYLSAYGVVKAAVEYIEAQDAVVYDDNPSIRRLAKARVALEDAVRRWKEAQA